MEGNNSNGTNNQTTVIVQQSGKSNGLGTAGFVLALLSIFLGWIPGVGWILWILGFIFSFCGIFKSPRGLAITGLVLSLLGLLILIVLFGAIGAALA